MFTLRAYTATHMVGGNKRIMPAQRNPGHSTAAESNRDAEARAADPGHQRRSIHRTNPVQVPEPIPSGRPRSPSGHSGTEQIPRARHPPRSIPTALPRPSVLTIRSPARMHVRIPHRAIDRRRLPIPVAVQSLVADRPGGNILRRGRRGLLPLARLTPTVKAIRGIGIREWYTQAIAHC